MTETVTGGVTAGPDGDTRSPRMVVDRFGALVAAVMAAGVLFAPFVTFRANRIVAGDPRGLFVALPSGLAAILVSTLLLVGVIALLGRRPSWRLAASGVGLLVLLVAVGFAASAQTPAGDRLARVSPAYGFWLLLASLGLLLADSITRLRFSPFARLGALAVAALSVGLIAASGAWNDLSLAKEYAARADTFGSEVRQHLLLALGSLCGAITVGVPIGILCHRHRPLRIFILQVLNIVQTIPSIALFGILMVPLGYVAATYPLAQSLGIRGIGAAPAFLALFLYALLPVVANTVVGLDQVPAPVVDAARGMGLSRRQRLFQIKVPLALPVILTGFRIVLVQNLGLATVAALIGGGGLGTFIFQGIGQTAMDLVLLGAIPIVTMAFAAAVMFDAAIEWTGGVSA